MFRRALQAVATSQTGARQLLQAWQQTTALPASAQCWAKLASPDSCAWLHSTACSRHGNDAAPGADTYELSHATTLEICPTHTKQHVLSYALLLSLFHLPLPYFACCLHVSTQPSFKRPMLGEGLCTRNVCSQIACHA